ncbi:uncharacterized protein LOC110179518 [Drosophila serrata]|uniref:uncharacterized protein LOC110179518 n=1 Tax=Drosophila serrata TaxID=7274 RepID=UPI000A1D0DDC|nr:uncharacterized protein LOC110179518 [Drosophila serrata]
MRILSILILTWVVAHLDQVSGKKAIRKKSNKGGPCGKPFLKQVNGRCYYVSTKKINWFGAQNNCLRKELNLADVGTPDDFKAITDFLQSEFGNEDYWIGGNDLQKEGQFNYISSGRLMHYMGESAMVEPTLRSNMDDCLELRIRTNTTVMLDVNCHDKKYFICENSQPKCAQPTAEDMDEDQRHSHEHLHHFHHDAGKKDNEEAAQREKEVESDSRPLDNSNSTEIGISAEMETTTGDPGEEATRGGVGADKTSPTGADPPAQNGTEEATTAGDAGATTAAGDAGATTVAETTTTVGEESTTTAV